MKPRGKSFEKGHVCPIEWRIKLSLANKGKKRSEEIRKKISLGHKGKKYKPMSEEGKRNLSIAHMGFKWPKEVILKRALSNTGKKRTLEARLNISRSAKKGNESNLWKGGVSKTNVIIRSSIGYKVWRNLVFERDNYTCVWCGIKGGSWDKIRKKKIILNAHHIKPFSLFPTLRFKISNGITLCKDCHEKTNNYGKH